MAVAIGSRASSTVAVAPATSEEHPATTVFAGIRKLIKCEMLGAQPISGTEVSYSKFEVEMRGAPQKQEILSSSLVERWNPPGCPRATGSLPKGEATEAKQVRGS